MKLANKLLDMNEGKDKKIKYIIKTPDGQMPMEWRVKEYGKPNDKNLENWLWSFLKSFTKGGANDHAKMPNWSSVSVVDQDSGKEVAKFKLPSFYVVEMLEGKHFNTKVRALEGVGSRKIRLAIKEAKKMAENMMNKNHNSPDPKSSIDANYLKEACGLMDHTMERLKIVKETKSKK